MGTDLEDCQIDGSQEPIYPLAAAATNAWAEAVEVWMFEGPIRLPLLHTTLLLSCP